MRRLAFYGEGLPGIANDEIPGKLIVVEGPDGVGRTTQVALLKTFLESSGYAVTATGMLRSPLVGPGIKDAKEGHSLGRLTMTLFYATDFADRLESQVLPALRAGFVVLADRYLYSAIARAEARQVQNSWVRDVYGLALVPDHIFYLRPSSPEMLLKRTLKQGGLDYWESGMDMHLGDNLYDSFIAYQSRIMASFERMTGVYNFETVSADAAPEAIFKTPRKRTLGLLQG